MLRRGSSWARMIILSIAALGAVGPLVGVVLVSLHAPDSAIGGATLFRGLGVKSFIALIVRDHYADDLGWSTVIALLVAGLVCCVSLPGGFALAKLRFRGRGVVLGIVLIGLVVPGPAVLVPLYYELRRFGLVGDPWGVILGEAAGITAFGLFWMRASFQGVPQELIDSAALDGASVTKLFLRIALPLARAGIVVLFLLTFLWSWNAFMLPLVVLAGSTVQTAPLGLASFQGAHTADLPGQAAAAVLLFIPMILLYGFNQRSFIQGLTEGAIRG
jgi:raffinose/stachyose/melibiose transport system permease protein